tara:strand:+ start:10123 stop:11631 length:1509 start_codon:yes stop_codon:yes gene_type:complete
MKTKTLKAFFIGAVSMLSVSSSLAQPGGNENQFLDQDYWKSKPSISDIDSKIAQGNSITEANRGGFDGVTYAIFAGNPVTTIAHLIDKGNDVNKRTHDSRTYIFWAASRGDLEVMEYLVGKGAKMDLKDSHGYSLSQFTAATGQDDTKIYDFLIANGADLKNEKDHDGRNILLVAAPRAKNLDLINYFVDKGLDLNSTDDHGNGIFSIAAQGGNIDILKQLAEKGVSTKANPETKENAILFASRGGRGSSNGLEVFKYLEGLGIDPNVTSSNGTTPLLNLSRSSDDTKIFDYFVAKGVDPNAVDEEGNTALLNAAQRNKLEVVTYFAEKTDNIDQKSKSGQTPLAIAIEGNSSDVVDYLISKGADVNTLDNEGNNLAYYLFNGRGKPRDFESKVAALKAKGFDFKTRQADDSSIWHLAVAKNDLKLLKEVSSFGSDINAKDKDGNTPLHYAAMKTENAEILKYLLSKGADAKSTTEFGETAHDLASENELLTKNQVNLEFLN